MSAADANAPAAEPVPDVLHQHGGPGVTWSRVNVAETIVGVQTPLSWSVWDDAGERSFRIGYVQLKLLPRRELEVPPSIDQQFTAIFYGHAACNIDAFRRALSAMPGTTRAAAEKGFFSSEGGDEWTASGLRRLLVRWWLPAYAQVLPSRLRRVRRRSEEWWRTTVPTLTAASRESALRVLHEAVDHVAHEVAAQIATSTMGGMAHGGLQALLAEVGRPDLEMALVGGYGTTEEVRMAQAMWDVAHDRLPLSAFLSRYGFHGPAEGELSSPSWREDPAPVTRLLVPLGTMGDGDGPHASEVRAATARRTAEQSLLAACPPKRRRHAKRVLARASRFIPLRVVAKAAFTQTLDVARAAARRVGDHLVAQGALADRDDVFYLTLEELDAPAADLRPVVAARRAQRERYLHVELPLNWEGTPEPLAEPSGSVDEAPAEPATDVDVVAGLGVSTGTVEGTVRVLVDPSDPSALDPGDVLVCHTTDPSWTSYFLVAAAAVIDVGGTLSHGAIVARELGIPCVINTLDGTRRLRSGDRVHVDGDAGTVRVLERAPAEVAP
jgi:pyruvate,water dikinase